MIIHMSRKRLISAALVAGMAAIAAAEPVGPSGPVSGAVFDRKSRSVRPILGVPGSSYLGSRIAGGLDEAAVSPDGRAVLTLAEGRLTLLRGLERLSPVTLGVEGTIPDADRIVWSPDSSAAALYSSSSRRIQLVRDLDKTPAAGPVTELMAQGRVASLGVDASGNVVAGVEGAGVFLLTAGQTERLLGAFRNPVSLLMARKGADLFVVDREGASIVEIRDFLTAGSVMPFTEGLSAPAGVALSKDARQMFVADAGDRKLKVFDVASRTKISETELDFVPTGLDPLTSEALSLIGSGGENQPYYILDGGSNPAVYFVPAGREE